MFYFYSYLLSIYSVRAAALTDFFWSLVVASLWTTKPRQ